MLQEHDSEGSDSPLLSLPPELQIEVLSRCPDSKTLGAALMTCKALVALAHPSLRTHCFYAWPTHAAAAASIIPCDTSTSACIDFWGRAFLSAVTNAFASRQWTPDPAIGLKLGKEALFNAIMRVKLIEWITEVGIFLGVLYQHHHFALRAYWLPFYPDHCTTLFLPSDAATRALRVPWRFLNRQVTQRSPHPPGVLRLGP